VADRLVAAAGQGVTAVRRDGDGVDRVGVADQALDLAAGADLPDAHHLVLAAREGVPAVGGEGQAEDLVAVPLEDAHAAALAEVPQVQVEVPAGGEAAALGPAGGG